MNLKELISKVSTETSLPAAQVRRVTSAVLESLRANVQAGENFTSPRLNVRAVTTKPSEKIDGKGEKVIVPEKKIGRLVPKERARKA